MRVQGRDKQMSLAVQRDHGAGPASPGTLGGIKKATSCGYLQSGERQSLKLPYQEDLWVLQRQGDPNGRR